MAAAWVEQAGGKGALEGVVLVCDDPKAGRAFWIVFGSGHEHGQVWERSVLQSRRRDLRIMASVDLCVHSEEILQV